MPAAPRKATFNPFEVGIYHCWNRCVRGAWLCGFDPDVGIDYGYRRDWILHREALLAAYFGIEVCWHAEMSNHLHIILRNRPDVVACWSDEEVVRRMLCINRITKSIDGQFRQPNQAEINIDVNDPQRVAEYRQRLSDISCFMAALCEHVSRRINADSGQSGTLWEGRFKCRSHPRTSGTDTGATAHHSVALVGNGDQVREVVWSNRWPGRGRWSPSGRQRISLGSWHQ